MARNKERKGHEMSEKLTFPTIHTNGTGKDMLFGDYTKAWDAINAAIDAIRAIEFNARDYYPQGPGAWEAACKEHYARIDKLTTARDQIGEILAHID